MKGNTKTQEPAVRGAGDDVGQPAHDRADAQPREVGVTVDRGGGRGHPNTSSIRSEADRPGPRRGPCRPGGGTRPRGRRGRTAPRRRRVSRRRRCGRRRGRPPARESRSTSSMLWLVTRRAVPSLAAMSSRPVRTRWATSGSRLAVGSSRTRSAGWCRIALTMPTSVRWPDESSMHMRSARCDDAEALEPGGGGGVALLPAQAVEAGEHRQRLPHAEALGQGEVAGHEPDPSHGLGPARRAAGGRPARWTPRRG